MSYASKVHRLHRFNRLWGRIFIPIWIGLIALFTVAATADTVWHLGWGYSREDALIGLKMTGLGLLFWLAWNLMAKLVGWMNEIMFGPDPTREHESQD